MPDKSKLTIEDYKSDFKFKKKENQFAFKKDPKIN